MMAAATNKETGQWRLFMGRVVEVCLESGSATRGGRVRQLPRKNPNDEHGLYRGAPSAYGLK